MRLTLPRRDTICCFRSARHHPLVDTTETEHSIKLGVEWQAGECLFCAERIMRFRYLAGEWFDKWGVLDLTLE